MAFKLKIDVAAITTKREQETAKQEERISKLRETIGANLADAEVYRELGELLIKDTLNKGKGDFSEGISLLVEAINLAPDSSEAFTSLGSAYHWSNEGEKANLAFEKARELNVNNTRVLVQMAIGLSATGHYKEALEVYDQAISIEPQNAQLYYEAAMTLHNNRQPEEALVYFHKALELEPSSPQIYDRLGTVLASLGQEEEATEIFEKAVELAPTNPEHWFNLALILMMNQERKKEAIEIFKQLVGVHPHPSMVQLYLAQSHYLCGHHEEAQTAYCESIKIDPTSMAYFGLAKISQENGDVANMDLNLREALNQAGKNPTMKRADIEICEKVFRVSHTTDLQIISLRKLIELAPDFPIYYRYLAEILVRSGRYKETIEVLNDLLCLCERDAEGKEFIPHIKRQIQQLEEKLN